MVGVKLGLPEKLPMMPAAKTKTWTVELCPACGAKDMSTNYFSGEVFCLKCGLVIY